MRHGKKLNHLGRQAPHRKAMLANMASSLIMHKRINTTLAKAKALRVYVEPLITKSKLDTTHSRRTVFSYLKDKTAVAELFRDVSVKIADRPGGYTRIIKLPNRLGDNAEMALIELVDFNENLLKSPKVVKEVEKRTRRSGGKKKAEGEKVVEGKSEAVTAEPATAIAPEAAVEEPVKAVVADVELPKSDDAATTDTASDEPSQA
jgi:large subunit ribosomal protein L17